MTKFVHWRLFGCSGRTGAWRKCINALTMPASIQQLKIYTRVNVENF